MPRRTILKGALAGLAAIPVVGIATRADAAAVKLDPNDAQAKSLGYVTDTTKVDAKANPMHKPEQKCANCAQFQGKATDASAPCTIFAGKLVEGTGWCKVWAKKPG
ncbi:MAG: high-potential iron-sulfur protein [Proteobacteria bacterium]|nr:high-potential iron-sulfur protein [Pseudomonadota bacterium]